MAIFALVIFIAIVLLIIEISTIILQSTGLEREVAHFQAISLLTGTGFTTTEAELITKHPLRRKIAQVLILFGSIAFAIIIAIFINLINQEIMYSHILMGIVFLTLLFFVIRFRTIQRLLLRGTKGNMGHITTLQDVFHLDEHEVVLEIVVTDEHIELCKTLKELNLATNHNIHIVTIARQSEDGDRFYRELIKYPTGSTKLQIGDRLTLFGPVANINQVFGVDSII